MNLRPQRREPLSLNITPLIDIVFLLLIFFMVTATFSHRSQLQLELPDAVGERHSKDEKIITISIAKDGRIAINENTLINNDINTLIQALEKESQGDKSRLIAIHADVDVPFQLAVTAMDAAGQLGFKSIRIATQKPN